VTLEAGGRGKEIITTLKPITADVFFPLHVTFIRDLPLFLFLSFFLFFFSFSVSLSLARSFPSRLVCQMPFERCATHVKYSEGSRPKAVQERVDRLVASAAIGEEHWRVGVLGFPEEFKRRASYWMAGWLADVVGRRGGQTWVAGMAGSGRAQRARTVCVKRCRDAEIQRYRDTEIQRCRDTEIQRYRDTEIQTDSYLPTVHTFPRKGQLVCFTE
jgi:hypothetical protein